MNLPKHIAIIMDGNGRWAEKRLRPRTFGHIKGARTAKSIITECAKLGIEHLTLYAFSTENWFRPETEVSFLMALLRRYLKKERATLLKENIRFTTIGDLSRLPKDVLAEITLSIEETKNNTGLHLVFALSYGGRQEITEAMQALGRQVALGELAPQDISAEMITGYLSTYNTPDPDLVIRTSGERRISNFMLWQAAYSELYFTSILWPDFTTQDLHNALDDYQRRDRRFGCVKNQSNTDEDSLALP